MLHVILIYFIGPFLSSPSNKPDLFPSPPLPFDAFSKAPLFIGGIKYMHLGSEN